MGRDGGGDRAADATRLRALVEELSAEGLHLAVVTGTHVDNVDGQLGARPSGPGRVFLSVNRGSEVFEAEETGLPLLSRREPTPEEDAALDAAARATVAELGRRGIDATVTQRLNRRKIDLIPLPEWADPPKARITELLAAVETMLHDRGLEGLGDAVEIATAAALQAGLVDARVTSDAKHVEIGLTDKGDGSRWLFCELWRSGVAPALVLVVGDEFGSLGGLPGSDSHLLVPDAARATVVSVGLEPTGTPPGVLALGGGPPAFLGVLEDQLARRRRRDVPEVDDDPAWTLTVEGLDPSLERVHESLLALADGRLGTRGIPALGNTTTDPAVFLAGVYEGLGPASELAQAPIWPRLSSSAAPVPRRRRLDMRTGVLREDGLVESVRFSSFARPATAVLRASGPRELLPRGSRRTVGRSIRAAFLDRRRGGSFERIASYDVDRNTAAAALAAAADARFERLLDEHRRAWAQRWDEADVVIEGDANLQHAVRFALFHLMGSVADTEEAAVGARGLTGVALPGPRLLGQRRLRASVPGRHASRRGACDARVPRPATSGRARRGAQHRPRGRAVRHGSRPRTAATSRRHGRAPDRRAGRDPHGRARGAHRRRRRLGRVRATSTGPATRHSQPAPGRELIVETARYWASASASTRDGRAHIYGVIGPDEYHEPVDDNAYTNVMARWNLRRAAGVDRGRRRASAHAGSRWPTRSSTATTPSERLYEQFAGFFELEPLVIAEVAPRRPIAADLLLGPERAAGAQVSSRPTC